MVFICTLLEYINHVGIGSTEKVIKEFSLFFNGHLASQASYNTNTRVCIIGIICIIIIYRKPGGRITILMLV